MKKIITCFLFSIILVACSNHSKTLSEGEKESTKEKINLLLNDWHLAAKEANFDNYFGKMDSISVFIGTDAGENWNKTDFSAFSKPYFDNGKAWDFKTLERNIYLNKDSNFAWFDELLNTWMGTCRGSGVLEKSGNEWIIKHYVLSVSIPNDDVQKVIAAKKKNDSIFLNKFKQ